MNGCWCWMRMRTIGETFWQTRFLRCENGPFREHAKREVCEKKAPPKGLVFSLDAVFAFALSLFAVFLLLSFASQRVNDFLDESQHSLHLAQSLAWMAQLIENRDEANPENGASVYLPSEKRVQSHWMDEELLSQIHSTQKGNVLLKELYFRGNLDKNFFREEFSGNCWSVERFVVLGERKEAGVLGGVFCAT